MDAKVKMEWERFLNPESLKRNIITAAIFSMAFEMLKSSIVDKLRSFYVNGFDSEGVQVDDDYKSEVLSLNKSPIYASLYWLLERSAIDSNDIELFESAKKCRNNLTHEMLSYLSSGVDVDVEGEFQKMVKLLRKINIWWFVNFEMAIDPDAYPNDLDIDTVVSGSEWSIQMMLDVALGSEDDAKQYYDHFTKATAAV
ncbi:hypothetical protein NT239_15205 [Chitinibacter sp. SCUT-21]|uniref:hypothetical protein n=1 Tax=Chitinibacter sp. SCUT-21 TaxID=2970891 RepID=UPI0035A60AEB